MKRDIREPYEQQYAEKSDNLGKMDKFLETHKLPKVNEEEIGNLNRQTYSKWRDANRNKTSHNEKPRIRWPHW